MLIHHKHLDNRGKFFILSDDEDEEMLAEIIYINHDPTTMIIEHTEVSEELKGQNIGYQLVSSAVEHARIHRMKIIPICPFAKAVMNKKPEFRDMLAEDL